MKHYLVLVDVKVVEIPEPEPGPRPGDDPMHAMVGVVRSMAAPYMSPMNASPALQFTAKASVGIPNFAALARVIERYDELTQQIECEQP